MSDARPTKDLFKAWRGGDAAAGQEMAQRFADWYYAIATSRLGEAKGNGPCQRACDKFAQGIVDVTESRALVDWAYAIIAKELEGAEPRAKDGDEPNDFTAKKKPKALLRQARAALGDEVALLEGVYSGRASDDEVARRAKPLGGMPIGVLEARYRVKRWLKANKNIPFDVVPEKPVLDRAPLPLYESGRMKTPQEEANFEKWMLTDLDLCKDIAEFAHFAIALRGGVGGEEAPAKAVAAKQETAAASEAPVAGGAAGKAALGGVALLAGGAVVLLVLVAAAIGAVLYFT